MESFKKISFGFKRAFEFSGVETDIERGTIKSRGKRNERMCFSSISLSDLCWKKKKIIGSAQYRRKDIVLQQGTIMLKAPDGFPVDSSVATMEMAAGKKVTLNELKSLIIMGFESYFDISFEEYKKNPLKEKILQKYSSSDWNLKGSS